MSNLGHFLENTFLAVVFVFLISFAVFPYFSLRPSLDNFSTLKESKVFGSYSFEISNVKFNRDENGVVSFDGEVASFSQKQVVLPKELLNRKIYIRDSISTIKVFIEGNKLVIINNSQIPVKIGGILY